jgi:hypothetical protein
VKAPTPADPDGAVPTPAARWATRKPKDRPSGSDRYARIRALKLPPDEKAKAINVTDRLAAMLITKRLLRRL